jgi:membrane-bound lytic murein transglycosylase A
VLALSCTDLDGWPQQDAAAALSAYLKTRPAGWPEPAAGTAPDFFARHFTPTPVAAAPGLLTGYYEPEVPGSLSASGEFPVPVHAPPPGWDGRGLWHSRAEIRRGNLLSGLELAWLAAPIEAFLAQVQGSLRVRLPDGGVLRLGYAGCNGHGYRSIGQELVSRGEIGPHALSAQAIRDWCARNPGQVQGLLDCNPSYVYFRVMDLPPEAGPIGAAGVPLTPLASLAVDPAEIAFGTPVWVESHGPRSLRRLMIAQDSGSAIRGAQRGDVFFGCGAAAGAAAGRMAEPARLVPLVPKGQR